MKLSQIMKTSWLIAVISLLVLIIGAYQVWLIWPSLVLSAIEWQEEVNAELADLLYSAQSEPLGVRWVFGRVQFSLWNASFAWAWSW